MTIVDYSKDIVEDRTHVFIYCGIDRYMAQAFSPVPCVQRDHQRQCPRTICHTKNAPFSRRNPSDGVRSLTHSGIYLQPAAYIRPVESDVPTEPQRGDLVAVAATSFLLEPRFTHLQSVRKLGGRENVFRLNIENDSR